AELDAATAEIEETQKKMRSTRKNALLQLDLKKRFEELSLAAGLSLENVNQLFSQLNRKNTVLFIARDIAEKKQDSFFIRRPALRVFAEEVAAARFISKYIEF
ncbi:MAG: replication/maintenance protein RepL, partial [Firmicutes bacterium]|nr:replication/maintenance protein RepL [Bacillota bacterium]